MVLYCNLSKLYLVMGKPRKRKEEFLDAISIVKTLEHPVKAHMFIAGNHTLKFSRWINFRVFRELV